MKGGKHMMKGKMMMSDKEMKGMMGNGKTKKAKKMKKGKK